MNNDKLNRGFDALVKEFENPGKEFRGKPFWSWNGELEENELKRQVDVLKEMGFGGYFMHSRAGLITEYLGDEWFDLINKTAEYGAENDMMPYLYDEDRWPSGCAGGIVSRDPKYRMKSIHLKESLDDQEPLPDNLGVFDAIIDEKTGYLKEYKKFDKDNRLHAKTGEISKILKFGILPDREDSVYNGATYIDTMNLEATKKFLEVTHEQYKERAPEKIWAEIEGIFTDEPHRGKCLGNMRKDDKGNIQCDIFYTNDIFDEFSKRYHYNAKEMLPEIFYRAPEIETSAKVKHDYVDLGCNLFNERFAKPINAWCEENGIDFTGHVLHENSLSNQTCPNGSVMRFYENMALPGIDLLTAYDNAYWVPKQLQSAARQLGKKWMLSELYGCTGWNFTFKLHKAVGDWQTLFGINLRCPHLSWYTMEGEAKRDYPASILHQASYWKDYNFVETYFARFGLMMTEGEPICDVLVVNPVESAWLDIYNGWAGWIFANDEHAKKLEADYTKTFMLLAGNQVDFDYGEEQMIAEKAIAVSDDNGEILLKLGEMSYREVVISGMTTIRKTTLDILKDFASKGGKVFVMGDKPELIDCVKAPFDTEKLFDYVSFDDNGIETIKAGLERKIIIDSCVKDNIFVQLRDLPADNAKVFAYVNTNREQGGKANVKIEGIDVKNVEEWSLTDGKRYRVEVNPDGSFDVNVLPAGSGVFVISDKNDNLEDKTDLCAALDNAKIIPLEGEFDYKLDEQNVMVLDFVSAEFVKDGEVNIIDENEILKVDAKIRDICKIEHRSGDSLQPWYAKKFKDETFGDVTLSYEFDVETIPAEDIFVAAERPERIDYYLNGVKLETTGTFWIDNALKTMKADRNLLKIGKNTITAKTEFKRTTNLESVYLVGNFGVKSELLEKNEATKLDSRGNIYSRHKVMTVLPEKLDLDNITDKNLLFYSGCIDFIVRPEQIPQDFDRVILSAGNYTGTLAKVSAPDGTSSEILGWEPFMADVTKYKRTGFILTLVCSRKNMFGPLHMTPAACGATGPGNFTTEGEWYNENYAMMDSRLGKVEFICK